MAAQMPYSAKGHYMAKESKKSFGNLIGITSEAFDASTVETPERDETAPKMVNHRQSVYRVPLSMIMPDRFQSRILLPYELREPFYERRTTWQSTVQKWLKLAEADKLIKRELDELIALGESLHDTGQIKPVTGQVLSVDGRDVFQMLTGERRFWATAIKAVLDGFEGEPYVLALIDNQPTLEKQIAENMAYKALTPVGKARAAARLVLEENGISPQVGQDELSYFRQISDVRLSDETRELLQRTLQMERTYFGRLMKFFELEQKELEIADRAEMPERVLREIMAHDRKYWPKAVAYYADYEGRTYQDVQAFLGRLAGTEQKRAPRMPLDPVTKSARGLRRVLLGLDDVPMDDKIGPVADALLGDTDKGEAKKLLDRMETLTAALRQRYDGMK